MLTYRLWFPVISSTKACDTIHTNNGKIARTEIKSHVLKPFRIIPSEIPVFNNGRNGFSRPRSAGAVYVDSTHGTVSRE